MKQTPKGNNTTKRETTKAREQNNTKRESKREQPKTAQILRFWHYLKKESANLCQIRANKGIFLLSTAFYPAGMIKVSARGKITRYRAKGGARGVGIQDTTPTQAGQISAKGTRGGVSGKRGHNNTKAGEGVCDQNGKGRVALKKISVQNPQNHFGYQNVLVSKKFSEKISGK